MGVGVGMVLGVGRGRIEVMLPGRELRGRLVRHLLLLRVAAFMRPVSTLEHRATILRHRATVPLRRVTSLERRASNNRRGWDHLHIRSRAPPEARFVPSTVRYLVVEERTTKS